MRLLYSLLLYLALPFILLRLWQRGKKAPAYKQRWAERFGYFKAPSSTNGLWIHAVSFGEMVAATPIIKALQQRYPNLPIVITNMTPTGSALAQKNFTTTTNVYAPYDYPGAIKRFLQRVKPKLAIIMETELWPNLIHYTHQQKIPILLANARLSARSAKGYKRVAWLTKPMLKHFSYATVQTQTEAERFTALGLPAKKIKVTGSIKFDITAPANLILQGRQLRQQWEERLVWIAASTHQGEDEIVLQAFATVRKHFNNALLILVPRHPERFNAVAKLCQQQGLQIVRRSQKQNCTTETNVFIGDTMGEMYLFYAASDVAFVGGSLVPSGGHNLLEPAALGLPILTGPQLHNFTKISDMLQQAGAAIIIHNAKELAERLLQLLTNPNLRRETGEAGKNVVQQNQGALQKHLAIIDEMMHTSSKTYESKV